jgi:hypothetical protein
LPLVRALFLTILLAVRQSAFSSFEAWSSTSLAR